MMNLKAIKQKIMRKIRTGFSDSGNRNIPKTMTLTDNVTLDGIRHDTITSDEGDEVLQFHSVPITKVGVQIYHDGEFEVRHFKTEDAVRDIKSDFSPVSFGHPEKHFREMEESKIEELNIGWHGNGHYDEKTQRRMSDIFLPVENLKSTDEGKTLLENIEKGKGADVSIGFSVEIKDQKGTFKDQNYDVQQVKIDHDHTAILVNKTGRFSRNQGVGMGAQKLDSPLENKKKKMEADNLSNEQEITKRIDAMEKSMQKKISDSDNKYDELKKTSDADKKELEKFKSADEKRVADATNKIVDSLVKRIDGKDCEEVKNFCDSLNYKQMEAFDSLIGSEVKIVDKKICSVSRSNAKTDKSTDDPFKASDEAAEKRHSVKKTE